jgi:hypothetical protein
MEDTQISFADDTGTILDRILKLYAHEGRDVAMGAIVKVVRRDVEGNSCEPGHEPLTLLWYIVGVRISGDITFHAQPSFVDALDLSS